MSLPAAGYDTAIYQAPVGDITGFTAIIDSENFSANFWTDVNSSDGTRGRFAKDTTPTEIAFDFIDFDDTGESGLVRVYIGNSFAADSAATRTIRAYSPNTRNTAYSPSDTYGSDNAYDANWEGYYPILGDSSTTMTDRTANGEDGTLQTGVTFSADKLDFASSNEGVDLMSSKPLDGGTEFTIVIESNVVDISTDRGMFYTDTHSTFEPIAWWEDAAATDFNAVILTASGASTGVDLGGVAISLNDTHQVISWESSDNLRLYIDSVEDVSGAFPDAQAGTLDASGSTNYTLGNESNHGKDFYGTMWNIQIHSVKRSDDWISEEFDQTNDNATFWGTWAWTSAGATFNEAIAESIGMAETQAGVLIIPGLVNESIGLTDAQSIALDMVVAIAEAIGLSETQDAGANTFEVSIGEGIGLSDAQSATFEISIAVAEGMGLADVQSTIATFTAQIAEAFGLTDVSIAGDLANGKLCVTISGAGPTITIVGTGTEITISGTAPEIDISGEGC